MAERRAVILGCLFCGAISLVVTAHANWSQPWKGLAFPGCCWLFAYIYANLTRPKDLL